MALETLKSTSSAKYQKVTAHSKESPSSVVEACTKKPAQTKLKSDGELVLHLFKTRGIGSADDKGTGYIFEGNDKAAG